MVKRSLVLLAAFGAFAGFGCRGAEGGSTTGPLASGQVSVSALSANGAYLYWTMATGSVRRVAIDGGKVETLAAGMHEPDLLAVDDTDVYVYALDGEILRIPKDGGKPTRLADGQNEVVGIQVDAVYVYWATQNGEVRRVPKNGGSAGLLATAPNGLTALAQQSAEIYWTAAGQTDDGALDSISANGSGPVTTLVQDLGTPQRLLVTPSTAFWTAGQPAVDGDPMSGGLALSRAALDGSDVRTVTTALTGVAAMVGDDATLFVATAGTPDGKTAVSSLPAAGGADPVPFASGPGGRPSLTLDDTSVYWASSADGNIFTLPKDAAANTTQSE